MKLIIHRGTHEIGGSCVEIIHGDTRIILDLGMPLKDNNSKKFDRKSIEHLPGAELVNQKILPDIKGLYSWDTDNKKVDAVLLSHAHLDHYGFCRYLSDDTHYYLGEGSRRLVEVSNTFAGAECYIKQYTAIKSKIPFQIGSITITPYLMDHSAFDSYAFLIEAGGKRLFYSGDFRGHGRKASVFDEFLKHPPKDVNTIIMEGTLMGQQDRSQQSEFDIEQRAVEVIEGTNNIILLVLSGANIDRFVSIFKAAINLNRIFVVDAYVATILDELKDIAKLPFPSEKVRVCTPNIYQRIPETKRKEMLNKYKHFHIKREEISANANNIVMVVRSSMLAFLKKQAGINGGTIIYSMWKGYADEKDSSMSRFLDFLVTDKGMEIVYLHTSGHAGIDTLKKFVKAINPIYIIPIHTNNPEEFKRHFPNTLEVNDGEEIII